MDDHKGMLDSIVDVYSRMNDTGRNNFLDRLLAKSSLIQCHYLRRELDCFENPVDFLCFLPHELTNLILSNLDLESLINCIQVCRHWRDVVSKMDNLWLDHCKCQGVNVQAFMIKKTKGSNEETAKDFCLRVCRLMKDIESGVAFSINININSGHGVRAVHLWRSMLFAATCDGIIAIHNLVTPNAPPVIIESGLGVTSVLGNDKLVLASYEDGTLASWNQLNSHKRLNFGRHFSSVLTFDFNHEMDLLVSGGADKIVKLFTLNTGLHRRTLRTYEHWIVKVLLRKSDHENILLTMERSVISVWTCNQMSRNLYADFMCTNQIHIVNAAPFFTPGLHCDGHYVYYIKQEPELPARRELCKFDLLNNRLSHSYRLDLKVKKLLGVGRKHACILKPCDSDTTIVIIDLETMTYRTSFIIPYCRGLITPDISLISFDKNNWLEEGFDGYNNNGPIMAMAVGTTLNTGVCVVRWREKQEDVNADHPVKPDETVNN